MVSLPCMLLWQHVGDSQLGVATFMRFDVQCGRLSVEVLTQYVAAVARWAHMENSPRKNCPRQCGLMLAARDGHFPPTSVELLHASHED